MKRILIWSLLLLGLQSCKDSNNNTENKKTHEESKPEQKIEFDQDSAYVYIQKQVDFGPRVPGSVAHGLTAEYLVKKLGQFADSSFIQEGEMTSEEHGKVPIRNIIGVINPEAEKRILLCAHWDTRPKADEDEVDPNTPADGANDGASGVGVLLEVARQLQIKDPGIGVDIIFFDAEDMGTRGGGAASWCLGSQYWSEHPHVAGYSARFGILLDMVGPPNAVFALEGHSMVHAGSFMKNVWRAAASLGHGNHFVMINGGMITDDHYFINTGIGIPTIDIINYDVAHDSGFGEFWHTHKDNMGSIDKETLEAVGETLMLVIYSE